MGFLVYSNNTVNMYRESFHLHNIRTRFFLGLNLLSRVECGGGGVNSIAKESVRDCRPWTKNERNE